MKKLLLIILLFTTAMASAQDAKLGILKRLTTRVDLFTDIWQIKNDSIKPGSVNPGISVYIMLDNPMGEGKSPWSYAFGAGITSENLFNNVFIGYKPNTANVNETYFYHIPKTSAGKAISYKKNKMVFTFLDIPFELRYRSSKGFKVAVGGKYGLLMGFHTKYKGDDPNATKLGFIKRKETTSTNMQTSRYGATLSVGYKALLFTGYYQLSKVYKDNVGPDMYPISLGITLHPFK